MVPREVVRVVVVVVTRQPDVARIRDDHFSAAVAELAPRSGAAETAADGGLVAISEFGQNCACEAAEGLVDWEAGAEDHGGGVDVGPEFSLAEVYCCPGCRG